MNSRVSSDNPRDRPKLLTGGPSQHLRAKKSGKNTVEMQASPKTRGQAIALPGNSPQRHGGDWPRREIYVKAAVGFLNRQTARGSFPSVCGLAWKMLIASRRPTDLSADWNNQMKSPEDSTGFQPRFCRSVFKIVPSAARMFTSSGICPGREWVAQPKHGS